MEGGRAGRRREDGRAVARGGAERSSGAETWRTHTKGAISPRENALAVPLLVSPLRRAQGVRPGHLLVERAEGEPQMVQIDYQFASERSEMSVKVNAEQVATVGPMITIFMATFCARGAVAARQCSLGSIIHLAAFLMGQFAASSGVLVLRADQVTSLTTLLDEIKARRAETLLERTPVESHQLIVAVEGMNREVAGLLRPLKATLEARTLGKMKLHHDLISWVIRHSAWPTTRFRVRASGHTACELIQQRKYGGAIVEFGEIVWARIPTTKKLGQLDQRWVEVVWARKAEGSTSTSTHHRGARWRTREQQMEA